MNSMHYSIMTKTLIKIAKKLQTLEIWATLLSGNEEIFKIGITIEVIVVL